MQGRPSACNQRTYLLKVRCRAIRLAPLEGEVGELGQDGRLVHVRHSLAIGPPMHREGLLQMLEGCRVIATALRDARELLERGRARATALRGRARGRRH